MTLNGEPGGANGNYSTVILTISAGYICKKSQARKLLVARKTDLLDKFISKAGKPFPAFLVMDKKGKVTFEFPERE